MERSAEGVVFFLRHFIHASVGAEPEWSFAGPMRCKTLADDCGKFNVMEYVVLERLAWPGPTMEGVTW